ncbi:MAG TPA: hypothetical protein VK501_26465 [Baekduia sp.]|uniref:hypothetical protein n=1 Tax=Baekduia sp. TaxID=2600305 RepID=UPI002BC88539|nr:hypothetical protein [Baekduia sp.]HMJ37477.1 hypothetical protein [Baekduia sp.]
MDINVLIPAMATGVLAALLGQRIARDRAHVRAGNKAGRLTTPGLTAAVCVALGAVGLALTAVIVLVQHKAVPPASAFFVVVLAVGIFNHAQSRRNTGQTDDAL